MTKDERLDLAVARHEAAHAIVAQKMGLPVAWVTIEAGHDEGINFGAATKIPDELVDLNDPDQRFAVCVSMAAPSFVITTSTKLNAYARVEAVTAYKIADDHGLESWAVEHEAWQLTEDYFEEIVVLSERLVKEGTVVFDGVVA